MTTTAAVKRLTHTPGRPAVYLVRRVTGDTDEMTRADVRWVIDFLEAEALRSRLCQHNRPRRNRARSGVHLHGYGISQDRRNIIQRRAQGIHGAGKGGRRLHRASLDALHIAPRPGLRAAGDTG